MFTVVVPSLIAVVPMVFAGVVLENGASAQQPDRRGGPEQRAVHTPGVRGGRRRDVQRGRLQASRVRAPETFHARHTQAGQTVLHLLPVAHHRRLQGPVHVRSTVGVLRRLTSTYEIIFFFIIIIFIAGRHYIFLLPRTKMFAHNLV